MLVPFFYFTEKTGTAVARDGGGRWLLLPLGDETHTRLKGVGGERESGEAGVVPTREQTNY